MTRHIYAIVVDCDDASPTVHTLLGQVADTIRSRDWPDVAEVGLHLDVPMAADERRQDRQRTAAVISLEERG